MVAPDKTCMPIVLYASSVCKSLHPSVSDVLSWDCKVSVRHMHSFHLLTPEDLWSREPDRALYYCNGICYVTALLSSLAKQNSDKGCQATIQRPYAMQCNIKIASTVCR